MPYPRHDYWMAHCLALARKGLGSVAPNPMVGAVLVDPQDTMLGEGFHEQYGGAHSEVNAIRMAELEHGTASLKDATLYVNLEPCNHHGKTSPCVDLILAKRIPRVIVGMEDPNPVAHGGIRTLQEHGVEVRSGVLNSECRRLNEAFSHHVLTGKPLISVKIAQTLDGRVADTTGASQWISGVDARARVHEWRARHGGILVGAGTAQRDDPSLTVRHVDGASPARYVLDRTGILPPSLRLFTDHHASQTTAIVGQGTIPAYAEHLSETGGRIVEVRERNNHLDLEHVLQIIGAEDNIQALLVEPGPGLLAALISNDLVDRLYVFIAPKLLGSGHLALDNILQRPLAEAITFADSRWETVGQDALFAGYLRKL